MHLKQQQRASWRYMHFLVMSVIYLGCIPPEVTPLFLTRGSASPASEFINVKQGETLSMNCSASDAYLQHIWWGKSIGSEDTWLTENAIIKTNDPRVSIATRSFDEHRTFSLQITDITSSDAGRYKCYAVWGGANSFGYIVVSVQYFPAENPICATNGSDRISTESIAVWCDTAIGNPEVTITWRVDHSDKEVTGSIYHTELPENERVRSVVKLGEHLQNQVLVCTVKSSAFPGQTRSCSIGPILPNTPATNSRAPTAVTLAAETPNVLHSIIPAALLTPLFVVVSCVLVKCILKRIERQRELESENRNAGISGDTSDDATTVADSVIPYTVTELVHGGMRATTAVSLNHGRKSQNSRFKVQLDTSCGVVTNAEAPLRDERVRHGLSVCDFVAQARTQDDDTVYEHVNYSSSSGVMGTKGGDTDVVPESDDDTSKPGGTPSTTGRSDAGMVDNPIYRHFAVN